MSFTPYKIIYKGFSTHNYDKFSGTFSLTNIDLVNMDILSHIYTQRGERVMMPEFGTSIPNSAFEPLTQELLARIRDDLEAVIDYDPRVERERLLLVPYYDSNSIVASVTLRYIELNVIKDLNFVINIDTGQ